MREIDRNAICARLEVVADALDLPDTDWMAVAGDDNRLLDFAHEQKQSIDWIVLGDVRNLIRWAAVRYAY